MCRSVNWRVLLWVGVALVVAGCAAPVAVTLDVSPSPLPSSAWHHYWRVYGGLSEVLDLAVDGEWLWVAAPQGLMRLNQRTMTYEQFSHTDTSPDVSLDRVSILLVDDRGRLWVGGGHGLVRYDDESGWTAVYTADWVGAFALDADGNLLRLTFHRQGGVNCERLQGQDPPVRCEWKYVNELVPAWDNCEAWRFLATYNWRYGSPAECIAAVRRREQLASLTLPEVPDPASLPCDRLIAEDADGAYWFWSSYGYDSAVIRYDGEIVQILPWTGDSVRAIVPADVKDGVWFGTHEGLFYSDGRTVQQNQLLEGRFVPCGPAVHSLAVTSDGHVWASTSGGLVRFDAEGKEWQSITGGEEGTTIESDVPIAPDDQGGLWALHHSSLLHLDGRNWRSWPLPVEIRSCEAHAVAEFRGEVWLAAGECGLWRFDGQAWDRPALDIQALTLIQGRDGKLYVQESGNPPYVYDGRTWTRLLERGWEDLYAPVLPPTPAPAGMSLEGQKAPMPMAVDAAGDIWGASETHIRRYSAAGEWADVLPLPGDFFVVQSLVVDSRGELWIGGLRGLLHYDGEHWEDVSSRDDTRLFPIIALAEDQQGRIWVGGDNGLSVYDSAAGE